MNIKAEKEELGESSYTDEPDVDEFDDSSLQYACDGEDDQDESSDVDFMWIMSRLRCTNAILVSLLRLVTCEHF